MQPNPRELPGRESLALELQLQLGQRERADTRLQIDKQVDVRIIGVVAAGNAAEDTDIVCLPASRCLYDVLPPVRKHPSESFDEGSNHGVERTRSARRRRGTSG